MSIDRRNVGRVTVFVVSIALGGALMAQSAGQGTQQPPAQPTTKGSAPPASQLDSSGVPLKPDATGPAPGTAAGAPTPVKFSGKVGPGGPVNAAIEGLGPGGAVGKAQNEQLGPGGTVRQTQTSQTLGPGAASASEPSERNGQQPAQKPGVTGDGGQAVNGPAAKGIQVFIDPSTGQIAEPTDAQLQELDQQNQAANVSVGQSEVVERPALVGGGMIVDIPASFYPAVTATIGVDGKITIEEHQAQSGEKVLVPHRPKVEQSVQSGVGQALGPAGGLEQSLRSADSQLLGPAGDVYAELPPPADVTVTIVNGDGAGEGFNDATAAAPVFGNPGTTRGAQRLNVFRAAGEYWGAILKSPVTIRVDARMDPQTCTATSAVLGSAGPVTAHRDFAGAPVASTWYVQATANSRAGVDLAAAQSDISATFNSDVDNPTCLGATSWWYGIGAPAPAGTIDFFTVVLHEIGHGIGFLSLVDPTTGAKFGGFDDAFERWLWDLSSGGWPGMTNAQRLASAINTGQVIFWGPRATAAARGFLSAGLNSNYPRIFAPNPVQLGSSTSHFDTVLSPNELMEPAITAPPGPYAYLTSGALEDIGWRLLSNGVFDFGGLGTWVWNPTDGWFQPTSADPTNLEPWNGNFVGVYGATWLFNGTSQAWSLLTSAAPGYLKECGNNLLWSSAAFGTWRYNLSTGWAQLTASNPDTLECYGGNAVWEGNFGTWIYNFSTGVWSQLTASNPTGVLACGSRLVWWQSGGGGSTWYWDSTGWHGLTGVGPETTECYRGQLAWEGAAGPGTWLYNFTTSSWSQITAANPEQMLAWGPNLVWESAAFGTWVFDGAAWAQITASNPTQIADLGADLLWSAPGIGTWVWSGGGAGAGTGWTLLSGSAPTEIVTTGVAKY